MTLDLLFPILVIGLIAYVVSVMPIPAWVQAVAYAVLAVVLLTILFGALGLGTGLPG